ncbi:sensor domain-containing diguanylate cyclase [Klebsiella sp. WP7-S18-CRE-02]|uniref:sensor domain-containing diguanylate cyclase n=1 Tax=Enterobacteriaceae TaxID=543 RepID=UPI0015DD2803|nr:MULTISPECIES: sensor domain-containing diguanylate cyclase [unclassified Klebsiella]HAT3955032.1 diguanylate cyclase [Kluyvera ascorbata]BBR58339.1 sensor domain-containing diguanylate cyclase [Klebsiella sp. WP4-W18-ESBL-05]BBS92369.1 sensor domain-containing diguanylate cyclase [Klebsiella sp. WP7-S18-CRE-02]BBS97399.1 sensor domain-containing diguanylate cyclase [Klebsiella sp. WP7-S18-CRE-03]BBT02466.1 sensor domain-containing diguanylate cyclase [Klebsiella sp. WP7-S18-ESBL-04]
MIRNLNFRRPLNICFLITAIVFTLVCTAVLALQWQDAKSTYQRQNLRYVQNLSAYTAKYLSGYESMLDETIKQLAANTQGKIRDGENLRHWLFERFNAMPDARSLIYASSDGRFIRLPNVDLDDETTRQADPRNKIWYTVAMRDDFDSAHYTSSSDIFDNGSRTLTISKSLVDNDDGEKIGVLAVRLNRASTADILNAAVPPLPGQKWIMDGEGQQIASDRGAISPAVLAEVSVKLHKSSPFFSLPETGKWYFTSAIGDTGWYLVHEVRDSDLTSHVFDRSDNVLYCLLFGLLALFICWWMVRIALNALYIRIANGIRNGAIEQKAAEEMLYEEIHNTSVQQENIKNEALTDGLTELKNRRAFDNDLEFMQHADDLCLAMIDIDNFKSINDTYGHATGDMVLKTVSDIGLRLRGLDNITLYRYGGEEIAVLFQNVSQEDARVYLERWRETCDQRRFREANLHVTFSAGLTAKGTMSIEEALALADKRLYEAKRNGKNRIINTSAESH